MQTLKLIIIFFAVVVTVLVIFGAAALRSQANYAAKMNAPALVSNLPSSIETVDETDPLKVENAEAGQKTKNQKL